MVRVTKDSVRRTLRTTLAVTLAVAAAVPLLVEAGVIDPGQAPWLASIVALAAAVTRLMASPAVDELLGRALGASWTRDGVIPGEAVVLGEQRTDVPPDPRYPPGL